MLISYSFKEVSKYSKDEAFASFSSFDELSRGITSCTTL